MSLDENSPADESEASGAAPKITTDDPAPSFQDSSGPERIRLVQGGAILLETDGFRVVEPRGLKRSPLHAYDSISHVYVTERVLLIGTTDGLLSIRGSDFVPPAADVDADADADAAVDPGPPRQAGPEYARRRLLARVAGLPGGDDQIRQISEVDRLGEREGPTWMVWATVLLCLVGTAIQLTDPAVKDVGAFLSDLFGRGEYWRAITAHFLHEFTPAPGPVRALVPSFYVLPMHLAVNIGGMLVLGHLVERPMGSWRTAIILAVSGVGTIVGIMVAGHVNVVGSSGLVAGLAGAMLALELHYARWMPSFWRLPRRLFITVILVQFAVVDQVFSAYLAGGAHLGGFAGGYVSTWLLGRPSLEGIVPTAAQKIGSYSVAMLVVIGFVGAIPLARHDMSALERHAARLLNLESAFYLYEYDNAAAWLIATEGGATREGLDLAVALADRAVANTQRLHPDVLDTLAEALFQRGDQLGAVLTIEEAIRLQPGEPYFFEQWRRFTGDRDPEDRPPPPGANRGGDGLSGQEPEELPIDPNAPRVTI